MTNQRTIDRYLTGVNQNREDNDREEERRPPILKFGDNIKQKEEGTVIVACQNVRGMKVDRKYSEEINAMKVLKIDVFGISEINVNVTDMIRTGLTRTISKMLGHGSAAAAIMMSEKIGYLQGGTSLITRGHTAGRMKDKIEDPMGHYSAALLEGKEGSGVLCISIYRVPQKKHEQTGSTTAHDQQRTYLREKGMKDPDPRNQILKDLT